MRIAVVCLRLLIVAVALLIGAPAGVAHGDVILDQWTTYQDRFVTDDGRVLDTGNNAVSHTEGQGWAMLFAEAAGDRAAFDKIWGWTHSKLQRPDNPLFSWRWDPADNKAPVADRNDATDGDILIGWALIRAGRRWHAPQYTQAAQRIVAEIRRRLIVKAAGRLVLLPGLDGFKGEQGDTIVNPSYYVYPALTDFARLLPSPEWQRLRRDGLDLLAQARFGRWGLTPDWLDLRGGDEPVPAAKFPARFGFDAIRVPLYLVWGGEATGERLASYLDFWNEYGGKPIPAWADVADNSVAPYAGSTGLQAIVQLTRGFGQPDPPPLPTIGDKDDYYAASLTLLAQIVRRETTR